MLLVSTVISALAFCVVVHSAALASESPTQTNCTLDPIALSGSPTHPTSSSNTQFLAVVQLHEVATLQNTLLQLQVDADVTVCLYVDEQAAIAIPPSVSKQAKHHLWHNLKATASVSSVLDSLTRTGYDVDVSLTPTDYNKCTCLATTSLPTCSNGQCACQACPAGQVYSTSSQTCVVTPSSTPGKLQARSRNSVAVAERQAKKADIIRRLEAKALTKTI